jgi:hypothetical protein
MLEGIGTASREQRRASIDVLMTPDVDSKSALDVEAMVERRIRCEWS